VADPKGDEPTAFSYVAAAVGAGLTLLLAGYLAYDAVRSEAPPRLRAVVVAAEVREDGSQSYVPVDVTNAGDRAAVQVVVETTGEDGEATVQSVIDYLAGGETRRVVAVVPTSPGGAFRARVVGYQEP
jgi:uncharacterized protein (TIGR02588 family)